MRYVTYEEFQREVTSWQNINNTINNQGISGRMPNIEELRSNYLLDNFVTKITPCSADQGSPVGQGRPQGQG